MLVMLSECARTVELNHETGGEDLKEAFEQVSPTAKFVKLLRHKLCIFIFITVHALVICIFV